MSKQKTPPPAPERQQRDSSPRGLVQDDKETPMSWNESPSVALALCHAYVFVQEMNRKFIEYMERYA